MYVKLHYVISSDAPTLGYMRIVSFREKTLPHYRLTLKCWSCGFTFTVSDPLPWADLPSQHRSREPLTWHHQETVGIVTGEIHTYRPQYLHSQQWHQLSLGNQWLATPRSWHGTNLKSHWYKEWHTNNAVHKLTYVRTYGSFILLYITVIPALVKAISMDSFKTHYKYVCSAWCACTVRGASTVGCHV